MTRNIIFVLILILLCSDGFAQKKDKKADDKKTVQQKSTAGRKKVVYTLPVIPAQSQYSDSIRISNINFTKDADYAGRGEVLEVQFALENMLDDPQDIYLFVIATYEKSEKTSSSFEMPVPERERLRSFIPFPDDIKNFQYEDPDTKGKIRLLKFPKNPKAGVDPDTGKPYHLVNKLNLWTRHLSRYRNNYFFFNEVAVLLFDKNGSPLFMQLYDISTVRH